MAKFLSNPCGLFKLKMTLKPSTFQNGLRGYLHGVEEAECEELEVIIVGVVEAGEERGKEGSVVKREVGGGHQQLLLLLVSDAQLALNLALQHNQVTSYPFCQI